MAGIRVGGTAILPPTCSPPMGLQDTSSNFNVYRSCVGDPTGDATQISDFSDGATVIDGVHNPRLSPDGTQILFSALMTVGGRYEIYVVDATPGSTPTQLVTSVTDSCYHASWAPDSDTFVYAQAAGAGLPTGGAIYKDTVSSPGSPTTIKSAAAGFSPYRPQFNFDGTKVAYWWQQSIGSDDLRCMNADGTGDAAVDTGVGNYDNNNPQQFGWANSMNMIAYDAGANAYVINSDGTGRVTINANGPAAGANFNVTTNCWAPDDSYVVVSANLGNAFIDLIRAELDGSNTTRLNVSHGTENQSGMRGAFVFAGRIWFIELASTNSGGTMSSTLLDGTDYRVDLDTTAGAALNVISGGDGFVFN